MTADRKPMTRRVRKMQTTILGLILFLAPAPVLLSAEKAKTAPQTPLLQLLAKRFGKLSEAETRLASAAEDGETADCEDLSGDNQEIRGELFAWLCASPESTEKLTHRGVSIDHARFTGEVNLDSAEISFPIILSGCVFADRISFAHARMLELSLESSLATAIDASETHFERDVILSGMTVTSGANLANSRIDGTLFCDSGRFVGGIDLTDAKIGGSLDCDGSQFIGSEDIVAVSATSIEVKGDVHFEDGFKAHGGVDLSLAKIGGRVRCDSSEFVGDEKAAALNLVASTIDRSLECHECQFVGVCKKLALDAHRAKASGIFLQAPFKADGGVDLGDTKVDGDLDCGGSQFIRKEKEGEFALSLNSAEVKGNVYLRDSFRADGGVDLRNAKVDGSLDCKNGEFVGQKNAALEANSVAVKGDVFLRDGFRAAGMVSLMHARIDGNLELQGGSFRSQKKQTLDLRQARAGTLVNWSPDSKDGWPEKESLLVDGLVYENIADTSRPEADFQLSWIGLQPHDRFRSQPFEQLADVLRKMGLDEDARKVMIAKNKEHARYVNWPEWPWYGFFGYIIGYGYSPWRGFGISLIVIAIGWFTFRSGYRRCLITPTGDTEFTITKDGVHPSSANYPRFNAFVYSLETFVPLVKLGIDQYWAPNANRRALDSGDGLRFPPKTGGWLRGYLWFHVISGWVLSALWVGGITGLVKT